MYVNSLRILCTRVKFVDRVKTTIFIINNCFFFLILVEDQKEEDMSDESLKKLKSVSFKKEDVEKPVVEKTEDSDDSDDWGSDSETETSSSDGETQYTSMRERFLKKTTEKEDPFDAEKKKQKKIKGKHNLYLLVLVKLLYNECISRTVQYVLCAIWHPSFCLFSLFM